MIAAAFHGSSKVVALLAEKGANIQAQDKVRENALLYIRTFCKFYMYVQYISI
jgi:hypothetical protein